MYFLHHVFKIDPSSKFSSQIRLVVYSRHHYHDLVPSLLCDWGSHFLLENIKFLETKNLLK